MFIDSSTMSFLFYFINFCFYFYYYLYFTFFETLWFLRLSLVIFWFTVKFWYVSVEFLFIYPSRIWGGFVELRIDISQHPGKNLVIFIFRYFFIPTSLLSPFGTPLRYMLDFLIMISMSFNLSFIFFFFESMNSILDKSFGFIFSTLVLFSVVSILLFN